VLTLHSGTQPQSHHSNLESTFYQRKKKLQSTFYFIFFWSVKSSFLTSPASKRNSSHRWVDFQILIRHVRPVVRELKIEAIVSQRVVLTSNTAYIPTLWFIHSHIGSYVCAFTRNIYYILSMYLCRYLYYKSEAVLFTWLRKVWFQHYNV